MATFARLPDDQPLSFAGGGAASAEGLDVPLEVILARMERAVGEYAMKLIRRDLSFGESTGNQAAIEERRQWPIQNPMDYAEKHVALFLKSCARHRNNFENPAIKHDEFRQKNLSTSGIRSRRLAVFFENCKS